MYYILGINCFFINEELPIFSYFIEENAFGQYKNEFPQKYSFITNFPPNVVLKTSLF